jgi:hypothetical protein
MQDVSAKLMGRFADCLAEEMRSDGAAAAPEPEPEPEAEAPAAVEAEAPAEASTKVEDTGVAGASSGVSTADTEPKIPSASSGTSTKTTTRPTDDVLDLGEASRDAVLKRALPLVGGVVALLILIRLIKR